MRTARRALRLAGAGLIVVAVLALVALTVGFIQFARNVSAASAPDDPEAADGIVVFTGGEDRVNGAVRLLADGFAGRLLISGVHPDTTERALAALSGGKAALFECCIDLGRSAQDTIGNASETAHWVRERGYRSLIVVTSSYHMPRSLAELRRALPDVRLEGHPVATHSVDLEHWWRTPKAASLLVMEYVKLLAARVRIGLDRGPGEERHAKPS